MVPPDAVLLPGCVRPRRDRPPLPGPLISLLMIAAMIAPLAAQNPSFMPLSATPRAVQKTIAAQVGDGNLVAIYGSNEDGTMTYNVAYKSKDNQPHGFSVTANGKLIGIEVTLGETPPAVQQAIQALQNGWTVQGIGKNVSDPEVTYDVEFSSSNGQTRALSFANDGTLLSVQMDPAEASPALQRAIQAQANGWQVVRIDKDMDGSDISYNVQLTNGGQKRTINIDDAVVSGNEVPVPLSSTPPAVQAAVNSAVGNGTLEGIRETNEDGVMTYDVGYTAKNGQEHGFSVAANGEVLSVEVNLNQTTPAAHRTIVAQSAGWDLDGIDQNPDGSFDVTLVKNGQQREFTVGPGGKMWSIQVALADTPPAAQQTIRELQGTWTLDGIDKDVYDPVPSYDVEVTSGGQKRSFTVGEDGKLQSMEIPLTDAPDPVQRTIVSSANGWQVDQVLKEIEGPDVLYVAQVSNGRNQKTISVADDGTLVDAQADQVSAKVQAGLVKPGAPSAPAPPVPGGQAIDAVIPADNPNGFTIPNVRNGSTITFQYLGGIWKSWGHIATSNPDDAQTKGGDRCRLAIALPSSGGVLGQVVAIVPPGTAKMAYTFQAKQDYPSLVLRINGNSFKGNPGKVHYRLQIQ